jgi:hypothetical protein
MMAVCLTIPFARPVSDSMSPVQASCLADTAGADASPSGIFKGAKGLMDFNTCELAASPGSHWSYPFKVTAHGGDSDPV